jgi:glycosyltransferase involved in cell wall biosynthesis
MKIVFLGRYNETEYLSGPEKVAKRLYYTIVEENTDTVFIDYFFKNRANSTFFSRLFGKQTVVESNRVIRLGLLQIFIFLFKEKPDVIHIITIERFVIPILLLNIFFKAKIVSTLHGIIAREISHVKMNHLDRFKELLLERLVLSKSNLLVVLSENHLNSLSEYYKLDRDKYCIVPHGADNILTQQSVKKEFNDLKIVYYSSNLQNGKAVEDFEFILNNIQSPVNIEVFVLGIISRLIITNPKIEVSYMQKLSSSEMQNFLLDKNIYINTNYFDSFSLLTLECMASGMVVIVSEKVGMSEHIQNGVNGFKYNPENITEVVSLLNNLNNYSHNYQEISKNAKKITEELNWMNISKLYLQEYNKIIK